MKLELRLVRGLLLTIALSESILLAPAAGAVTSSASQKNSGAERTLTPLKIGTIKDDTALNGCGCSFNLPLKRGQRISKYVFMAEPNEETALMNVNGEDVELKLFDASKERAKERVGDRSYRKYRAAGLTVRADYVVKSVCKPDDESCETTWYGATFTVTRGARKRVIKAEGGCGC